jgi:micrococcal nuclease
MPMRKPLSLLVLLFLALLFSAPAGADQFTGTVVRVIDGDTVEVLEADKAAHRVRLAGIDTPERGQAFGTRAKQALLARVGGETVTVEWDKRDRYRRIIGKLVLEGQDVNLSMVEDGYAWWYRKYAREQSEIDRGLYEAAEERARHARTGLWRDPEPVSPWDWRRRKH